MAPKSPFVIPGRPLHLLAAVVVFFLLLLCLFTGPHRPLPLPTTAPGAHAAGPVRRSGGAVSKTEGVGDFAGYLAIVFLGADPYIYFYLSDGNNPVAYRALNQGKPIIRPTQGTRGVRDPAIVKGGGSDDAGTWYIVGTDLDIGTTSWGAAQRTGSRGILVWESSDLLTWTGERLVAVEDSTAGMVWAPEAIWDATRGQYMVYWASKFYAAADTRHTGSPTNTRIRCAYTSDFRTFSAPQTYVDRAPSDSIGLTILPLSARPGLGANETLASAPANDTFFRFLKDETRKGVFMGYSTSGLLGPWTRPGGGSADAALIATGVEGPAAFWDNEARGKVHLLLDFYGSDGYRPYESTSPMSNSAGAWTASSRAAFPKNLRHGSVLPVTAAQYAALAAKWG